MKLNINDYALVHLTADGVIRHTSSFTEIGKTEKDADEVLRHAAVGDGRHRFQIWELMKIFGDQMYNGNPKQMFVKNIVEVIPA